jgi:hypothetical protein
VLRVVPDLSIKVQSPRFPHSGLPHENKIWAARLRVAQCDHSRIAVDPSRLRLDP